MTLGDWFWGNGRSVRMGYLQMEALNHLMSWVVESVLLNDQFRSCRTSARKKKF